MNGSGVCVLSPEGWDIGGFGTTKFMYDVSYDNLLLLRSVFHDSAPNMFSFEGSSGSKKLRVNTAGYTGTYPHTQMFEYGAISQGGMTHHYFHV
jgi:hypothetical protein